MFQFAHLKWFENSQSIKAEPVGLALFALVILIVLGGLIALGVFDYLTTKHNIRIRTYLKHFSSYVPTVVSFTIGLSLVLFSAHHQVLADPYLHLPEHIEHILIIWQLIVGILLVLGLFVRAAALALVLMIIVLASQVPALSTIEHLEYFGAALYLLVTGAGYMSVDRLFFRPNKLPNYRLATNLFTLFAGASLIVVALSEKLLDVPLAQQFLQIHHWNFLQSFGISSLGFIAFIGAMELLFGIALVSNIAPRFVIANIAAVMCLTALLLGPSEVVGHLFAVGLLAAIMVEAQSSFTKQPKQKHIVIVGGGFGGVVAALELAKQQQSDLRITLITDKPHFEYHAALYRVVNGYSPLEVCVPLDSIFAGTNVEIVQATASDVDMKLQSITLHDKRTVQYDELVLALGSETSYMNIAGLEDRAYGFKTINEALELKKHLHSLLDLHKKKAPKGQFEIVVVGGGASGVELAGELAHYTGVISAHHGFSHNVFTIDLVEAGPDILPILDRGMVAKIKQRLARLDIGLRLSTIIVKEDVSKAVTKSGSINTKTLIWTAGVAPNKLLGQIRGLSFHEKSHKVLVDHKLRAKGYSDVYVIGDGAATQYSGMAQTAVENGIYVARTITEKSFGLQAKNHKDKPVAYAIPVGTGWAATKFGMFRAFGYTGWMIRKLADLKFFIKILPLGQAVIALSEQGRLTESCEQCAKE